MMLNVVRLVRENKGKFEWTELKSVRNGYTLYIKVFRDAMKFDNIPALTWNFKQILNDNRLFNGVRLPATAEQLQEIADLLDSMLLTPKVIDMIWLQATIKFDSIINVKNKIVAITNITDLHQEIEREIIKHGGDDGVKLISCVGKYWCLINELTGHPDVEGDDAACNYGWFAKNASGPGITPGVSCWQRPGFRHNKRHWDPSQTIRLMHRMARLIHPDGTEEHVDLHDIAKHTRLAFLMHHQGVLTYLRQHGVIQLSPIVIEPEPAPEPIVEPEPFPKPVPLPLPVPEPKPKQENPKGEPIDELKPQTKSIWQAILDFLVTLFGHK